jgi:hypothetical protein
MAIAQTSFDTGESHERAALRALLSALELEGVLIQAARCTPHPRFSTRRRAGCRLALDRQKQPKAALSADRLPISR